MDENKTRRIYRTGQARLFRAGNQEKRNRAKGKRIWNYLSEIDRADFKYRRNLFCSTLKTNFKGVF